MNEPGNCGEIIAAVYELTKKNSKETVRRLGTIIQSIFLCPIRSQHSLDRLEVAL